MSAYYGDDFGDVFEADQAMAEMQETARRLSRLRRRGLCTHGGGNGRGECTDGCGARFASFDDQMRARAYVIDNGAQEPQSMRLAGGKPDPAPGWVWTHYGAALKAGGHKYAARCPEWSSNVPDVMGLSAEAVAAYARGES